MANANETLPGASLNQTLELTRFDQGGGVVRVMDSGLGFRTAYTITFDPKGSPSYSWCYDTGRGRRVLFAKSESEALEQIRNHLARNSHI